MIYRTVSHLPQAITNLPMSRRSHEESNWSQNENCELGDELRLLRHMSLHVRVTTQQRRREVREMISHFFGHFATVCPVIPAT